VTEAAICLKRPAELFKMTYEPTCVDAVELKRLLTSPGFKSARCDVSVDASRKKLSVIGLGETVLAIVSLLRGIDETAAAPAESRPATRPKEPSD
jgi:hypothetical protein